MEELAGLSDEDRKRALDRFRLLKPHLEKASRYRPSLGPLEYHIERLTVGSHNFGCLAWRRWREKCEMIAALAALYQGKSKTQSRVWPYRSHHCQLQR